MQVARTYEVPTVQAAGDADFNDILSSDDPDRIVVSVTQLRSFRVTRFVAKEVLPDVIAAFYLANGRFFGSGRITGSQSFSAEIESLTELDGPNLLANLPKDYRQIDGAIYASHAAASYALELWCTTYIDRYLLDCPVRRCPSSAACRHR